MDSVLNRLPLTPTRAKSAGPTRPHRDLMEDADSSGTRKRPRLDSGNSTYRSMSADRLRATPTEPRPATTPSTLSHGQNPSRALDTTSTLPPMSLTPSKVTINVRESAANPSVPQQNTQVGTTTSLRGGAGDEDYPMSLDEPSIKMHTSSPNVISVGSSPPHSPEIEVAEIEDMNDEAVETKWQPLTRQRGIVDARHIQQDLLAIFPYSGSQKLRKTLNTLAGALERNDIAETDILAELADWIEKYLQATEHLAEQWWDLFLDERDFWETFPLLAEALVRRGNNRLGNNKYVVKSSDGSAGQQSPLRDFLIAYAGLTTRMAQIDLSTLVEYERDPGGVPDLVSDRYLATLLGFVGHWIPFWKSLLDASRYDTQGLVTAVIDRFVLPPSNGVELMTQISDKLLELCQTLPALIPRVWIHLNLAKKFMEHYRQLATNDDKALLHSLFDMPSQIFKLCLVFDDKFKTLITKQVPALSIESSQGLVSILSELLRLITYTDEQLTRQILRYPFSLDEDLDVDDGPSIVELAWKLEILKKCIFEGRMEIRVQGVDNMQRILVNVYSDHVKNSRTPEDDPFTQYISNFMLANKLVAYFVGVESHPQLISRCGNIIGFLAITGRYKDAETDIIWRAVMASQDSRFVDAVLMMLATIFNIIPYPALIYLATKVNEVPLQDFDSIMIKFTHQLFDSLRRKCEAPGIHSMGMPPYHVCIRLIRQSAVEGSLDPLRKREIHQFADTELRALLDCGPKDADRRTIYDECLQDISNRTDFATGSIAVINSLLLRNPENEIVSLCEASDITSLAVGELAHEIEAQRSIMRSAVHDERLSTRFILLTTIINHVPHTITTNIGSQFWNYSVGSESLSDFARHTGWTSLIRALRSSFSRNAFIDRCILEFLPRLQPRFYCTGCIMFVQDSIHYYSRTRPKSDVKQESPVGDLIWQLALRAPFGTIEQRAINMLVNLHLDSPEVQQRTSATNEIMHTEVVERCIRQLASAAQKLKAFSDGTSSGEDEPMVHVASDDEVQTEKLSFSRSLMILKEFVRGVRSRTRSSPKLPSQAQLPNGSRELKGESINILYQMFGSEVTNDIRTLEVNDGETLGDLQHRMNILTGFSQTTLISGGGIIDLPKYTYSTLRDWKLGNKGLLIVKKAPHAESTPDLALTSGLRPVEIVIMAHFSELYQLLAMDDSLGKEVLEFLVTFPPHASIKALVCSEDTPLDQMFPPSTPFKILYSIHAFNQCLRQERPQITTRQRFMRHCIQALTTAISTMSLNIVSDCEIDMLVANAMIDCVMSFLKDSTFVGDSDTFFSHPLALLDRLNSLTLDALKIANHPEAETLACTAFAALLRISILSDTVWRHFKHVSMSSMLLQRLLLDEPNVHIRSQAAVWIKRTYETSLTTKSKAAQEFLPCMWNNLEPVIPYCLQSRNNPQQFFEVAIMVFRQIDRPHCESLELQKCISTWSSLLLQHIHREFVGRDTLDWIIYGLASLLKSCLQVAKDLGASVQTRDGFLETIFRAHLFPSIADVDDGPSTNMQIPNLHTSAREVLYTIALSLSDSMDSYQNLLLLVRELLPKDDEYHAWTWGIATPGEDYNYEINFNFERAKMLRSYTGYPGLRNLSNTCYMNSLFTQLFMNVRFREFMLGANVADSSNSQKLLYETQNLFGYMQETMLKAVDSQAIADSIVTYDSSVIDVHVQMDVDEFYNLLFDRWESQILSRADKKAFRAFYGGEIVQQIKSKECPHISERLEPFSAIQCDILGKPTLVDSLNAYVEGEVMEGDNKYSCTSCNAYVAAVKRACFKDIPDNLIFHLKRFDYDVMTGVRSKINDRFEFPQEIDMAPYHVDYLSNPDQPPKPDIYELVGVLVHTGTAESGHYYSYIRERPQNSNTHSWVEFNDMDVSKFDPSLIPDQSFGGLHDSGAYANRYYKVYNAYMLFYERIDGTSTAREKHHSTSWDVQVKCAVPSEIQIQVNSNNAAWLRTYCLFDPAHATFSRQLLEQLRVVNKGTCTPDHKTEKETIWLSLDYLERILSRTKDCPNFGKMLGPLQKVIGSCPTCCNLALEWVAEHKNALRNLLLRVPTPSIRKDFGNMIFMALQYLRKTKPQWYGFQESDDVNYESSSKALMPGTSFTSIAAGMEELWVSLWMYHRGWDDYFGLLVGMANLGVHEAHQLMQHGFLHYCFEILIVESSKDTWTRSHHHMNYLRCLEKQRKYPMNKLLELLAVLLSRIDFKLDPVRRIQERRVSMDGMAMTKGEDELMLHGTQFPRSKRNLTFLEKALNVGSNPQAAAKIVRYLTLAEDELHLLDYVQKTIQSGINVDPACLAGPWLTSAATFLECTPYENNAQRMIDDIATEVDTIGYSGGREHLDFFIHARRITSFHSNIPRGLFNRCILIAVPQWAPALLSYWEEPIRRATYELLKSLVFSHDTQHMDDEEYAELIDVAGKGLQVACLQKCNNMIQLQKTIDSRSVEQIVAVIEHCCKTYYDPEESDSDKLLMTETQNVLGSLQALTVEDVDEAASDMWNNASDELPTDSDSDLLTSP